MRELLLFSKGASHREIVLKARERGLLPVRFLPNTKRPVVDERALKAVTLPMGVTARVEPGRGLVWHLRDVHLLQAPGGTYPAWEADE